MRLFLTAAALTLTLAAAASAGTCQQNFTVAGLPLLSQIEYRTAGGVKGVDSATAMKRIASALRADGGYYNIKVTKRSVTASQETSGSGRPQGIRFDAAPAGNLLRIDAVFVIQQGQLASERIVRRELCRLIGVAQG
ncbi:MAG: hypothetical protein HC844_20060 [Tabrizicola sp.]|nr:hypothetical protein [Tabrizicola sp.]